MNFYLLFLSFILITICTYIFISFFKNTDKNLIEFFCAGNPVNYNDYCDVTECDYTCDPTTLFCDDDSKCRWLVPQKAGQSCKSDDECLSKNCHYSFTGQNKNIGECK
jgi:hypothetical protein